MVENDEFEQSACCEELLKRLALTIEVDTQISNPKCARHLIDDADPVEYHRVDNLDVRFLRCSASEAGHLNIGA